MFIDEPTPQPDRLKMGDGRRRANIRAAGAPRAG
jgi:hypothetical protein